MSIPVISIVGRSNSGKTTLLEKLLREIKKRGYRTAAIKHSRHGFETDREGKDSYRHKQAGADISIISSPSKITVIKDVDHDLKIDDIILKFIEDVDIVFTEGYKKENKPKIEAYRKEAYPDLLCSGDDNLLAIASDSTHDLGVPQFDINDTARLADLIEEKFLKRSDNASITLVVDGNIIPLKPFIGSMLINSIKGMISELKNCSDPKNINLRIDSKTD